jgi:hypothetical protein
MAVVTGAPPTFRLAGAGSDVVAGEVLDFADAIGLGLEPWQSQVLSDWTLVDAKSGRWSHR